jgi:hypothetical protein
MISMQPIRAESAQCTIPRAYTHAVRAQTLAVACAVALSSCGCMVVSLHPAYDDASIQYDEGLIGAWKSDDEDTTVQVAAGEWRSYHVTLATPLDTTTLTAHLTRIDGMDVLDLMPATGVDLTTLSIAVHVIVRLKRDGDVLSVSVIDYESARRAIPKPFGLPAVIDERQNVVITAGTEALRRELAREVPGRSIFGPASTLHRVQAG